MLCEPGAAAENAPLASGSWFQRVLMMRTGDSVSMAGYDFRFEGVGEAFVTNDPNSPQARDCIAKIIEFVQAGEWGMLDSLIEAMPTELAEHLLDGAEFSISPEIQSPWLRKATWLRKLYMASAKSSGWSGGDEARACILALAISSRTGEKSIYRKKANRIKTLDCSDFMSSGQRHVFDRKTHAAFIIDLLNRALSAAQNLEKIE